MQKVKVEGHSVQKLEWKQTDGWTDEGDCITSRVYAAVQLSRANAVV